MKAKNEVLIFELTKTKRLDALLAQMKNHEYAHEYCKYEIQEERLSNFKYKPDSPPARSLFQETVIYSAKGLFDFLRVDIDCHGFSIIIVPSYSGKVNESTIYSIWVLAGLLEVR